MTILPRGVKDARVHATECESCVSPCVPGGAAQRLHGGAHTSRMSLRYTAPSTHGMPIPIRRSQMCVRSRSSPPPAAPPSAERSTKRRLLTEMARCSSRRNSRPERMIWRLYARARSLFQGENVSTVF
jgi:hypothetical protein